MLENRPPIFIDRYCAIDGVMANPQLFSGDSQCIVEHATTIASRGIDPQLGPEHLLLVELKYISALGVLAPQDLTLLAQKCRDIIRADFQSPTPLRHFGIAIRPETDALIDEAYTKVNNKRKVITPTQLVPATLRHLPPQFRHEVFEETGVNIHEVSDYLRTRLRSTHH